MDKHDYENTLSEFRNTLLTQKWFLEKQSEAWKNTENFVGHHFSNTIVFLGLFLLGGLSVFLLIKGTQLQQSGATFGGGVLLALIFLTVAISYYLVNLLKKKIGTAIYFAYKTDEITRSAYLEQISTYENTLQDQLHSLTKTINRYAALLDQWDPDDQEQIKKYISDLNELTGELKLIQTSLADIKSLRNEYSHSSCFDFEIHQAIMEHKNNL